MLKFDATCYQILAIVSDDEPLSGLYDFFDGGLSPLCSSTGNERNIASLEEPSPGRYDHFFDSVYSPSELDLLFDCVLLDETFNWIDL